MEQLSACITNRMIDLDIICSDDKDFYCYSVQGLLEKITCLTLIIVSASLFHSLVGVIAFLVVFMLIRRSSDGIHCKTTIGCFLASTVISLSTIVVVRIINGNCAMCIGGGGLCDDYIVHNSNLQQSRFKSYQRGTKPP